MHVPFFHVTFPYICKSYSSILFTKTAVSTFGILESLYIMPIVSTFFKLVFKELVPNANPDIKIFASLFMIKLLVVSFIFKNRIKIFNDVLYSWHSKMYEKIAWLKDNSIT